MVAILWQLIPDLDIAERDDIIRILNRKYWPRQELNVDLYNDFRILTYEKAGTPTIKDLFLTNAECKSLREHLESLSYPLSKTFEDYIIFVEKKDISKIYSSEKKTINIANQKYQDLGHSGGHGATDIHRVKHPSGGRETAYIIYILIDIEKRERERLIENL